nr:hypothetical protein L203_05322 [Cryptococcus depauperatus CBS 7841]
MSRSPSPSFPETQFISKDDDDDNLYDALDILDERGPKVKGEYLVKWSGVDQLTGLPWEPSWVAKNGCTDELIKDWKEKKRKDPSIVGREAKKWEGIQRARAQKKKGTKRKRNSNSRRNDDIVVKKEKLEDYESNQSQVTKQSRLSMEDTPEIDHTTDSSKSHLSSLHISVPPVRIHQHSTSSTSSLPKDSGSRDVRFRDNSSHINNTQELRSDFHEPAQITVASKETKSSISKTNDQTKRKRKKTLSERSEPLSRPVIPQPTHLNFSSQSLPTPHLAHTQAQTNSPILRKSPSREYDSSVTCSSDLSTMHITSVLENNDQFNAEDTGDTVPQTQVKRLHQSQADEQIELFSSFSPQWERSVEALDKDKNNTIERSLSLHQGRDSLSDSPLSAPSSSLSPTSPSRLTSLHYVSTPLQKKKSPQSSVKSSSKAAKKNLNVLKEAMQGRSTNARQKKRPERQDEENHVKARERTEISKGVLVTWEYLDSLEAEKDKELEWLKHEYEKKEKDTERELIRLQGALSSLQALDKANRRKLEDMKRDSKALIDAVEKMKDERARQLQQTNAFENLTHDLKAQLQTSKRHLQTLVAERNKWQEQSRKGTDILKESMDKNVVKFQMVEEENQTLSKESSEKKAQMPDMEHQSKDCPNSKVLDETKAALTSLQKQHKELQIAFSQEKERVQTLTRHSKSLEKKQAGISEDLEFVRSQYNEASTRAVEEVRMNTSLRDQVTRLKEQLRLGLAQRQLHSTSFQSIHFSELRKLRAQLRILLDQARLTDDDVRNRARLYEKYKEEYDGIVRTASEQSDKIVKLEERVEELLDQVERLRAVKMGLLEESESDSENENVGEEQCKTGKLENLYDNRREQYTRRPFPTNPGSEQGQDPFVAQAPQCQADSQEEKQGGSGFLCKWRDEGTACMVVCDTAEVSKPLIKTFWITQNRLTNFLGNLGSWHSPPEE